jgi:hypothetical protein
LLSSVNIEHVKKLGRRKVGVNAGKAWPLIYVAMSHLAVDLELKVAWGFFGSGSPGKFNWRGVTGVDAS